MDSVVFDIETDGLTPTKIHCLAYDDKETGGIEVLTDYKSIKSFFKSYDVFIGHNIRRYDIPALEKLLDIVIDEKVIDTLAVAWYLDPKRPNYKLENYGDEFGIKKPVIIDWENQHLDTYIDRCKQDVKINARLWGDQLKVLREIYPRPDRFWSFLKYLDFKMWTAHLAEKSRWRLDVKRCTETVERLELERAKKREELAAAMPKVPIVKSYFPPKRMYNSDGQLSLLGQRWQNRLIAAGLDEGYEGPIEEIAGYDEPNPGSPVQLKDWLFSLGWKPQTIKYQKNKETNEIKEIPQVNKEHGGGVCDSVLKLVDKEPALEYLDGLSVLSHRIGLLNGFLRDVDDEGYIRAAIQGLTNTLRFKHAVVVNLPKVGVKYGTDIRGSLIARDGHELCGSDMASLEDRIKQHFIYPFDPDYVDELNRPDYDPHLDLAYITNQINPKLGLTSEQVAAYKNGDETDKPVRSIFKNGNYACQYGAGPPRLVITCGIDLDAAKQLHEAYWTRNWAIKKVAESQKTKMVAGQQYLYNPVSKFWYPLRTEKDIFSTLVQGTAAYCFDTWVSHIMAERPQVTAQFHDEVVLEVLKGYREEITKFLQGTIEETNDYLKLNRRLDISIQFGDNYAEIH